MNPRATDADPALPPASPPAGPATCRALPRPRLNAVEAGLILQGLALAVLSGLAWHSVSLSWWRAWTVAALLLFGLRALLWRLNRPAEQPALGARAGQPPARRLRHAEALLSAGAMALAATAVWMLGHSAAVWVWPLLVAAASLVVAVSLPWHARAWWQAAEWDGAAQSPAAWHAAARNLATRPAPLTAWTADAVVSPMGASAGAGLLANPDAAPSGAAVAGAGTWAGAGASDQALSAAPAHGLRRAPASQAPARPAPQASAMASSLESALLPAGFPDPASPESWAHLGPLWQGWAHDLRQPLHAATLYCSLLQEQVVDTPSRDLLTRLSAALASVDRHLEGGLEEWTQWSSAPSGARPAEAKGPAAEVGRSTPLPERRKTGKTFLKPAGAPPFERRRLPGPVGTDEAAARGHQPSGDAGHRPRVPARTAGAVGRPLQTSDRAPLVDAASASAPLPAADDIRWPTLPALDSAPPAAGPQRRAHDRPLGAGPRCALAPVGQWLMLEFLPQFAARGLRFAVLGARGEVAVEPLQLERLLRNLVGNALRHTRRGGVVVVFRKCNGRCRVQVRDSGPGLGPEPVQGSLEAVWPTLQGLAAQRRAGRLQAAPQAVTAAPAIAAPLDAAAGATTRTASTEAWGWLRLRELTQWPRPGTPLARLLGAAAAAAPSGDAGQDSAARSGLQGKPLPMPPNAQGAEPPPRTPLPTLDEAAMLWPGAPAPAPAPLPPALRRRALGVEPPRARVTGLSARPNLGLGLAIVRLCAARMGTRVLVHARPGRGTVFECLLPWVGGVAPKPTRRL